MSDKILDPNRVRAKKMMLLFALLSITMTFAGLTSAYIVSTVSYTHLTLPTTLTV